MSGPDAHDRHHAPEAADVAGVQEPYDASPPPSAASDEAPVLRLSDPAAHARRAASFGAQAAAYAEHRPDYPEAGVRWALHPATHPALHRRPDADAAAPPELQPPHAAHPLPEPGPSLGPEADAAAPPEPQPPHAARPLPEPGPSLRPDAAHGPGPSYVPEPPPGRKPLHVLDLAAGTGKLTATLVALGHRVTAVDPDPAMLAQLRRHVPGATALTGGAEQIPLPDASVDAVVVGQAFHWFDQSRALPEIARVLRPGGSLAALWNADDDRVPWIAGLTRITAGRRTFTQWPPDLGIAPHPAFSPVAWELFAHRQPRTADSLVATVATHSSLLVLEPAERNAALERVRDYLRTCPQTADGPFDLRIVTRVARCVRLPAA